MLGSWFPDVGPEPILLTWSGGTAPYILSIIPGGDTSSAPLETLVSDTSDTSYTWTVNLAAGTEVNIKVTDNTGVSQYSSQKDILSGGSSSCLNSTATSIAGAAGATTGATSAASSSSTGSSGSSTSSSMGSMTSSMSSMASSSMGSSTSGSSASSTSSSSSSSSSKAATTSGAAFKKYEAPAALLAIFGGIAALL
ncbi:hypothetical protein BD324DRAFT_639843 [Kockovaella imperatae]|uniref:Ser-Thr-rich glycosyl-phosphatidyl-inositol-anchored membrane family-domain-containing protein n=1 Tax=Kockovaella imperatae TaxID=4999 RepID=A0A1Y1U630_9TREE|nr:hypothetical protein BD324DRAFT_639843 [Kockovaella imperatae]ORX33452.1 hypothetical protein BD324DRAFT_639843 [Kockovaella imperatae]